MGKYLDRLEDSKVAASKLLPEQSLDRLFKDLHITRIADGIFCGGECDWGWLKLDGDLDRLIYRSSVGLDGEILEGYSPHDTNYTPPTYERGPLALTFTKAQFKEGQIYISFIFAKKGVDQRVETMTVSELRRVLEL